MAWSIDEAHKPERSTGLPMLQRKQVGVHMLESFHQAASLLISKVVATWADMLYFLIASHPALQRLIWAYCVSTVDQEVCGNTLDSDQARRQQTEWVGAFFD